MALQPDAVFIAEGGRPLVPQLPGLDTANVLTIPEALDLKHCPQQKKIVVIGGGMTGCETSEKFAMMGNEVTLVEMKAALAPEVDPDNLVTVLKNLHAHHAQILTSHQLIRLDGQQVHLKDLTQNVERVLTADEVILSLGERPNHRLYAEMGSTGIPVVNIGDSVNVGRIAQAVHSGYEAAYTYH